MTYNHPQTNSIHQDPTSELVRGNIWEWFKLRVVWGGRGVVYFDQRIGAPHAVRWSKSFFEAKTTLKSIFTIKCLKNRKK